MLSDEELDAIEARLPDVLLAEVRQLATQAREANALRAENAELRRELRDKTCGIKGCTLPLHHYGNCNVNQRPVVTNSMRDGTL